MIQNVTNSLIILLVAQLFPERNCLDEPVRTYLTMSDVCKDLLRLLDSEKHYDVLLSVGEDGEAKEFKAHSLILCARSHYFAAAFGEKWATKEDDKYVLNKPNVTPATMDFILRFVVAR